MIKLLFVDNKERAEYTNLPILKIHQFLVDWVIGVLVDLIKLINKKNLKGLHEKVILSRINCNDWCFSSRKDGGK